jgi:hypothetical protein
MNKSDYRSIGIILLFFLCIALSIIYGEKIKNTELNSILDILGTGIIAYGGYLYGIGTTSQKNWKKIIESICVLIGMFFVFGTYNP